GTHRERRLEPSLGLGKAIAVLTSGGDAQATGGGRVEPHFGEKPGENGILAASSCSWLSCSSGLWIWG
uniref:Uncharacterized protein n=1 Tax=Falco tinnunculus TaxID=100819 RepID=A0A8C4XKQ5_FALTI